MAMVFLNQHLTSRRLTWLYELDAEVWSLGFNEEFLTTTLRDKKLFCSSPSNVNGPWDCRPWFDSRPIREDRAKREEFVTFIGNAHGPKECRDPKIESYLDAIRREDDKLNEAIETCSQLLLEGPW